MRPRRNFHTHLNAFSPETRCGRDGSMRGEMLYSHYSEVEHPRQRAVALIAHDCDTFVTLEVVSALDKIYLTKKCPLALVIKRKIFYNRDWRMRMLSHEF